jgi:thiol-disulfide isomerase/thioredoxin
VSSRSKSRERPGKKKGFSRNEKIAGLVILFIAIWAVYSFTKPSGPPVTTTTGTTTNTGTGSGLDFTLQVINSNGLTSEKISLSQFRGRIVLLEFMSPFCVYCQQMQPTVEQLYQQFGPQNVVFLLVSGTFEGADANDAAKFIQNYNSKATYVYDSSGTVFNMFGVNSTPTFFIIGKDGQVLQTYRGVTSYDTIAADLTRFNS